MKKILLLLGFLMATMAPALAVTPAPPVPMGYCTGAVFCAPAIGDTRFSQAVTTTITQVIAAPSAGSIHITSYQIAAYETATGGYIAVYEGTGVNCVTGQHLVAIILTMTAAIQMSGNPQGTGVGTVIGPIDPLNAVCVGASAGTIGIANFSGNYATY